ncbi:MAG: hypothetical protein KIT84_08705 [Labilithrix sp.]|nr:hypothetical protein [Labilithrix sp.]MCW5811078.1 hypothetical protein [Labilithrix sp.]
MHQQRPQMERISRRPRPATDPQREDDEETSTSLVLRIGIVVAGGVASGIASSLPAVLRLGGEGSFGTMIVRWVILSALAIPIAVLGVAVLRRARVGVRQLLGERAPLLVIGVLWWAVTEIGLLAIFGAVLRKTTHHHALAGVTFAFFAVISGVIVGLLARRTTSMIGRGGGKLQTTGLAAVGICATIVLVLVIVRTARAEELHAAAGIVDAIALTVGAMLTSTRTFTRVKPLAVVGLPAAILILVVGLTMLRFDTKLRGILPNGAPLHALVLDLFGR